MYYTTRGIFLRQVKYSDTSVIARMYTEDFGVQSYIIKGFHSKKSKIRPAMLQPLSLLEMVVTHKEKSSLQHIKELRSEYLYASAREDIRKNTIVFFLNELLNKTLHEEQENKPLFSFIHDSLVNLDRMTAGIQSFHILFAIQLTRYLGFFPEGKRSEMKPVFDLTEGNFIPETALDAPQLLKGEACMVFDEMLVIKPGQEYRKIIQPETRETVFNAVLMYYMLHIPGLTAFKSPAVLHTILK